MEPKSASLAEETPMASAPDSPGRPHLPGLVPLPSNAADPPRLKPSLVSKHGKVYPVPRQLHPLGPSLLPHILPPTKQRFSWEEELTLQHLDKQTAVPANNVTSFHVTSLV